MEKIKELIIKYKRPLEIILLILLYVLIIGDCLIKKNTGFPCPTCGLTRAITSLFKGDLYSSIHYHLFAIPALISALLYVIKDIVDNKYKKQIIYFISIIGTLFIIYYIYRMYYYFPLIEPMDYNYNSYLYNLLN